MKKSIFLFFAAILCAMSANAYTVYLNTGNIDWAVADAKFKVWTGSDDVEATKIGDKWYSFEVGETTGTMYFKRCDPSSGGTWNEFSAEISSTKNIALLTDWSAGESSSSLHVTGDDWNGIGAWDNANEAGKMTFDGNVFTKNFTDVTASAHQFKLTFNGTWSNAVGYNSNTCSGTNCEIKDNGGNIQFTPLAEGTVTITYTLADGKILITCPEPPAAEYNITYPTTQTNYTLTAGVDKAQAGAEVSFTATPADGYVLNVTYNGNAITGDNNVYTFMMPATDVTIAITAVTATTLYYVDHNNWGNVNAYMWSDSGNNSWPGVAMTQVGTVGVDNYAYYSVSFAQGTYTSIIFNIGDDSNKTSDLTIDTAKPYFYDGAWYTWDDLLAKLAAPAVSYDYYLTGSLVGGWDAKQQGLEKDGEVYKATIALTAGTYEFKITDGQWNSEDDKSHEHTTLATNYVGVSGGNGNNIEVALEEAKDLIVTFNSTEDKIYLNLDEETASLTYRVQVPEGTEACYIAGPCNDWSFRTMDREGETDIFTISIVGAKETDEYKYSCQADWAYAEVIEGGGNRTEWTALDKVEAWGEPADPAEVKCYLMGNGDWENGVEMEEDGTQFKLLAHHISAPFKFKYGEEWSDQVENYEFPGIEWVDGNIVLPEGIYDFYFKKDTKKVYIAEAGYARNVTNTYGTICLPYAAASTTGAYFYQVAGKEEGKVYLESVDALEAGVPYIFEKTANQIKVVYTGEKTDEAQKSNGLYGVFEETTVGGSDQYILYNDQFRLSDGTAKVAAYRAYLIWDEIPNGKPQQMPGRRYIGMDVQGENETTGVEDLFTTDAPVKVIENGQLIIIRDGVKYNVQGQMIR